jgi:hypothetical protein
VSATATTTNVTETVDTYLRSLTEADPAQRPAMIARAWSPEGRYLDPHHDLAGYAAIEAAIAGVVAAYPGFAFRRTTTVDAHHECIRFGWEFTGPDGVAVLTGMDVGVLGGDGRLASITGFHGDLAPA